MGSKHKKDRASSSSPEDSDSSREHKRHKKDHKKDKHKKHKKHKKQGGKVKERDREQERLVKEAKRFLKQKLKSGDPEAAAAAAAAAWAAEPAGPPYEGPVEPITADDYFTKNPEFTWWLRECRGKFFSEQSTEQNRGMFLEFVEEWNSRRCPAQLYTGDFGRGGGGAAPRTSFAWGIKGAGQALAASGAVGMAAALDEELNLKEQARAAALQERSQQRREAKERLEELVPKLSGKDKVLEEKRARRELGKAGDASPEHVARGFDVLGGGEDSFAAAKAREAARQQHRGRRQNAQQAEVAQRVAAAQAAEAEKMAAFRSLLSQGPIQIAKRQG